MPCTSKFDIFLQYGLLAILPNHHVTFDTHPWSYVLSTLPSSFQDTSWHLLHPLICRAYTVPVQVGFSQQNLSLQVDTGSSDLVRRVFLCTHTLPDPSFPVDCIHIMLIGLVRSNEWASV